MINIKVYKSLEKQTEKAFEEVSKNIKNEDSLIIFYASTVYDYPKLARLFNEKFPKAEVVGLTTVGEINNQGIHENSLSVSVYTDLKYKAVFVEDIHKFPIFAREELIQAAKSVGINLTAKYDKSNDGVALVFPNGLVNAEERMLSVVNSIFKHEGFPVFGGTAGDDAKFVATYNSLNDKVSTTSGVVVFMKFREDFKIYKESLFNVYSDEKLVVTKGDTEARVVYEFNGKKATSEYARILGIKESELNGIFMKYPLGFVGKNLSVASPMVANPDGSIAFYCQIPRRTELKVLNPKDVIATMDETVKRINNDFESIQGSLVVNCILRKIQFQQDKIMNGVNEKISKIKNASGFCSYGEQLNNEQHNQTMVVLSIGKLKNKEGEK